jgi:hypothetical protein
VEELTTKLGQQMTQENKEGNNSDGSGKEEDASNSLPGSGQVFSYYAFFSNFNKFLFYVYTSLIIIVINNKNLVIAFMFL